MIAQKQVIGSQPIILIEPAVIGLDFPVFSSRAISRRPSRIQVILFAIDDHDIPRMVQLTHFPYGIRRLFRITAHRTALDARMPAHCLENTRISVANAFAFSQHFVYVIGFPFDKFCSAIVLAFTLWNLWLLILVVGFVIVVDIVGYPHENRSCLVNFSLIIFGEFVGRAFDIAFVFDGSRDAVEFMERTDIRCGALFFCARTNAPDVAPRSRIRQASETARRLRAVRERTLVESKGERYFMAVVVSRKQNRRGERNA